jgi:uncharacterized protein
MRTALSGLLSGALFGAGLALADLTNPAKIQNFLDVFGRFDPSLAVVMATALLVSGLGYARARRMQRPWLGPAFALPARSSIDAPLVYGSALFGVGWGLAGLCPGPALADLLQGSGGVYVFCAAMVLGMALHRWWLPGAVAEQRAPDG